MKNWLRLAAAGLALMAAPAMAPAAELRYAGATAPLTLDPHGTSDFVTIGVFRQLYDPLVNYSLDMEIQPGLATEWTYQGDSTWRFRIREGVKFHDGQPMTVDDVVFSIERQRGSAFYATLLGDVKAAVRVDDHHVDVVSNNPDPILPRKMTRLWVMSKAWVEKNGVVAIPDIGAAGSEAATIRQANGTGPMKLKLQEPGIKTVFSRNHDYWAETPGNVEEATYVPIGAAPTRLAALLSGEVDLILDLPLQDVERVKGNAGFKVTQTPQLLWMALELDGTRPEALDVFDKSGAPLKANPFKDPKVRLAIAHAVDAQLIVDRVMRGHARVVGIPSVPGLGGYQAEVDERWPTDVAKAKELMAEAGYPDGFGTQFNCPADRYVNDTEICRSVAAMLARIGIDAKINSMLWPDFARMLINGPTSSFHLIAQNSWHTQDMFTGTLMTRDSEKKQGFFNFALWSNAEFDATVNELRVTFDEAERNALFVKALKLAKDNVHAVYLHQPMVTWGSKAGIDAPIRADAIPTLENIVVK